MSAAPAPSGRRRQTAVLSKPAQVDAAAAPAARAIARCRQAVEQAFGPQGELARSLAGFRPRAAQRAMALAVFDAIVERGTLAAEAGTGTGKTLAYLVPALLAGGRTLICAGTKTLQDQIFTKDLPAASRALGLALDAALLKGRQNYVCRLRLERTAAAGMLGSRDELRALQHVVRFAQRSVSGDRAELAEVAETSPLWPAVTSTRENCLGAECRYVESCFVVLARRRALAATVVVVNHHLLLADMALREQSAAALLPAADVVIVDEAHQLTRIAADFFGSGWSLHQAVELAADTLRAGLQFARDGAPWPELVRAVETAARGLRLALAEAGVLPRVRREYGPLARNAGVPAAVAQLNLALGRLGAALQQNQGREAEVDLLLPRLERLRAAMEPWHDAPGRAAAATAQPADASGGAPLVAPGSPAAASVQWVLAGTYGAQFHISPLSCAEAFAQARDQRVQAWILTSATLAPQQRFEPFLAELGLSGARACAWDSPYDYGRQALLYLPAHMPNPQQEDFAELVAAAAWPVLWSSRGRAFVLCSTLRAVAAIAQRLRALMQEQGRSLPLLVQGEATRRAMLEQFRRCGNAILVGSVSFWEGIDVRGAALSVVVIDKLPFAPPDDPVIAARMRQLQQQGRNAFWDYQLPHAATLLRQGAGRLIRADTDRGVLMILDERLLSRGYGAAILASLPAFARTRDEAEACAFVAAPATAAGAACA